MGASVEVRGLSRRFAAGAAAVDGVTFDVRAGETLCIVGPSGCGKSTTLRLIAGLERANDGEILIEGRNVRDVPPQARDVAMVFQGFALYPHMTVREHLAFPLQMRKVPRAEQASAIDRTADMLGLAPLLGRRPAELSGGERQRVAMGRAIVRSPKVFLFDEPLSNLDAALRAELRLELGELLRSLAATALYVTHDQTEAMTLGHRIALMRGGRIEQLDVPRVMYREPATAFAAGFFGAPPMNLVPVQISDGNARAGSLVVPAPAGATASALLGVRPEDIRIVPEGSEISAPGRVTRLEPHGAETHVDVSGDGWVLRIRVLGFAELGVGDVASVAFAQEAVRWFAADSGRAL